MVSNTLRRLDGHETFNETQRQAFTITVLVVAKSLLVSLAEVLALMALSVSEAVSTAKDVSATITAGSPVAGTGMAFQPWMAGAFPGPTAGLRGGGGVKPHEALLEGQGQK